jgi:N-acetylglutamate synthase-like GNAT family acetyltransferase
MGKADSKRKYLNVINVSEGSDKIIMVEIIGIREHPEWLEEGAKFFHQAFGSPDNYMLYYDCIEKSLHTESPLPRWFIAVKDDKIIGGCSLITNDFISRMDLWPWLAALYVNEEERGQALGSKLLSYAVKEAGSLGFPKVYLSTDHDGYYEKYGWTRIEDAYMFWGEKSRVYEISTNKQGDVKR